MSNLRDYDKTERLQRLQDAIDEGTKDLTVVSDDGTSHLLEVILPRYTATVSFRRMDGDGWAGDPGYAVEANGSAKFVSEVLAAASNIFLESEER